MTRTCYAAAIQALTPDFEAKAWSSSKINDASISSLDGLGTAFTEASKARYPKAFPEHTFSLCLYGLKDGKRVYDIKYFEAQGVVASHGRYHTGPAFSRTVSTLDELFDAIVEAKAAMAEAFPSTEGSEVTHREAYFSRVCLWSSAKSSAKAAVATKPTTNAPAPEPEPEVVSDGPAPADLFGEDDDDW